MLIHFKSIQWGGGDYSNYTAIIAFFKNRFIYFKPPRVITLKHESAFSVYVEQCFSNCGAAPTGGRAFVGCTYNSIAT